MWAHAHMRLRVDVWMCGCVDVWMCACVVWFACLRGTRQQRIENSLPGACVQPFQCTCHPALTKAEGKSRAHISKLTRTHTHVHTQARTCTHTRKHTHTHVRIHTHASTHTRTLTHTRTKIHAHTCTHASTRKRIAHLQLPGKAKVADAARVCCSHEHVPCSEIPVNKALFNQVLCAFVTLFSK